MKRCKHVRNPESMSSRPTEVSCCIILLTDQPQEGWLFVLPLYPIMEVERLIDENNALKTRACSAEEAVHRLTGRLHSLEEQMVPKGQHVGKSPNGSLFSSCQPPLPCPAPLIPPH